MGSFGVQWLNRRTGWKVLVSVVCLAVAISFPAGSRSLGLLGHHASAPAAHPSFRLLSASRALRKGSAKPAGEDRARVLARPTKPKSGQVPSSSPHAKAQARRTAGARVEAAATGSTTVTFDDFPEDTPITDAYAAKGVLFASPAGNASPFIASDSANPTSPVLSGSPRFSGNIIITFVIPGTQTRTRVDSVSLDVGYIDNPGSVQVLAFSDQGIEVLPADSEGIDTITTTVPGISAIEVVQSDTEPAGFAIDNVNFTPGTAAATGLAQCREA
jgi:hypothetical protein